MGLAPGRSFKSGAAWDFDKNNFFYKENHELTPLTKLFHATNSFMWRPFECTCLCDALANGVIKLLPPAQVDRYTTSYVPRDPFLKGLA
jgi:hypothetical protein